MAGQKRFKHVIYAGYHRWLSAKRAGEAQICHGEAVGAFQHRIGMQRSALQYALDGLSPALLIVDYEWCKAKLNATGQARIASPSVEPG